MKERGIGRKRGTLIGPPFVRDDRRAMTAGAASILARRAERAAEAQRRLEAGRAAAVREAAERAAEAAARATTAAMRAVPGGLVPGATQHAKTLSDKKKC